MQFTWHHYVLDKYKLRLKREGNARRQYEFDNDEAWCVSVCICIYVWVEYQDK